MASTYAARQLARKLKLEAILTRELMVWFRSISATIKPVLRHTGSLPSIDHFRIDLVALLRKHYSRVGNAFMGDVSLMKQWQIKQTDDEQQSINDATLAAFLAWSVTHAQQQSAYIIATTQDDLQSIYADAQTRLAQDGEQDNVGKLSLLVAAAFAASYIGRTSVIATTETQSSAEQAKLQEANATMQVVRRESTKTWHTLLDDRTRASHVLADLQEQPRSTPFTVGGERLMIPGDTSLGASPSNIIGCRCSAEYTAV